ncbi:hypothetical protein GGP41_004796 [Bipolaris sorokiniana]|uniref:Uncharacterized protein n=1 Tax=Cochliobolus sativus TaxID=45130 RepID=A0A8H6DSU6_COCSA|nr:hypothetical protein GGP41_004796 [Bipolaris sorokiniana]
MTEVAGAIGRGGFFARPQCSMILTALAASANANLPSPQYTRNRLGSMPGSLDNGRAHRRGARTTTMDRKDSVVRGNGAHGKIRVASLGSANARLTDLALGWWQPTETR